MSARSRGDQEPIRVVHSRGPILVVAGLCVVIVTAALTGVKALTPRGASRAVPRSTPVWMTCNSAMRDIGQALMLYANEHDGRYPDRLDELVAGDYLADPVHICCPTHRVLNISSGEGDAHSELRCTRSFSYHGKGLTRDIDSGAVLVYESVDNHPEGSNMLFASGIAKLVTRGEAKKLIEAIDGVSSR